MKATITMEGLWKKVQTLPLNNQKWLSERLIQNIKEKEHDEYISKEEILKGIATGLKEVKAGEGMLAGDFLKELRSESYN